MSNKGLDTQARFSVIVPLYNKASYVEASLKSILVQGEWVREIVVVNDGSTDAGPAKVRSLAQLEPKVVLIDQENAGVSAARNRGIQIAEGEYIAFLDADDLYLPGYFEEIARLITMYPSAGVFATAFRRVKNLECSVDLAERGAESRALVVYPFRRWLKGDFFCTCSVCIPRRLLVQEDISFPLGERMGEDQDVWFRLAERFPVAFSERQLVLYRVSVSDSLTVSNAVRDVLPCYSRLADRVERAGYPAQHRSSARKLVASHYINVARSCLRSGLVEKATRLLRDRRSRSNVLYWFRAVLELLSCRYWNGHRG